MSEMFIGDEIFSEKKKIEFEKENIFEWERKREREK